jgi:transposase
METMAKKKPRARRSFSREFKDEIVGACQGGDRSIGQVARDFDLTETAVREWVRQAGSIAAGGILTTAEREELAQLRRENHHCGPSDQPASRADRQQYDPGGGTIRAPACTHRGQARKRAHPLVWKRSDPSHAFDETMLPAQ